MPGRQAEPRSGVLEECEEGGHVRHVLLGRPLQDGDALAVRVATEHGSSWLPVRYVRVHGPGSHGLQASWCVRVDTTHEPREVTITLPPTALLRWALCARPLCADEAAYLREAADEIDAAAAGLRLAMASPSGGLGDAGRGLIALKPGYCLRLALVPDRAGRVAQPPADADLAWLDEFADKIEQEVARQRAVQRAGARLLAQAGRLRELAVALEGPAHLSDRHVGLPSKEGTRMRTGAESAWPQPALMLSYEDLLLLEAVLCFHTRASTSADLRARLGGLWERVSRVRTAAASPRSVGARAQPECGHPAGRRGPLGGTLGRR